MEVAIILSNSARYSSQFMEEFDKLFVLALLSIIPIVNFMVLGYFVRVVRSSPVSYSLPSLDSWGRMFADGVTVLIISLCYLAAGVAASVMLFYLGSSQLALLGMLVVFLGFLLLPVALVHSVRTGDPSRAFSLREIMQRVSMIGPLDYFLFVMIIFVLPLFTFAGLALIPILGWFLAFLLIPVIGTFVARASALAYEV